LWPAGHGNVPADLTRYARSGTITIAYQVVGRGPPDLVFTPGAVSHIEVYREQPELAGFFRELSSFCRLMLFDKRGTGLSDRGVGIPSLEERCDDIRAVMDAAGSKRAIVAGVSEGAPMALLFAAMHPDRVLGLVVYGGYSHALQPEEEAPNPSGGSPGPEAEEVPSDWGTDAWVARSLSVLAPSRANDPTFRDWFGKLRRYGASPRAAADLRRMNRKIDVRSILPSIHVPTLVLHVRGDRDVPIEQGREVAAAIPGAHFVELPGDDHLFFANPDATEAVVREVREFVGDTRSRGEDNRVVATVLFTDVVSSTQRAAALGDSRWGQLLHDHLALARQEIGTSRGRTVKTTGDGVLAVFDGPSRAVRCAFAIRDGSKALGLEIRAGLHAGECVVHRGDIEGIAVHIAARILEQAGPGEVVVSPTVRDLSVGSGLEFSDRGTRALRGVPGKWHLYSAS
jgi:pimeloyl-ACP methyl ester carboxylesterase